ncbi:unnamed protein product [Ectocarpus sp. 12 AP-2014]
MRCYEKVVVNMRNIPLAWQEINRVRRAHENGVRTCNLSGITQLEEPRLHQYISSSRAPFSRLAVVPPPSISPITERSDSKHATAGKQLNSRPSYTAVPFRTTLVP